MVGELLPAPDHQLPHQHRAGEVPAGEGGACPSLIGLVCLLDGQGLKWNVQSQQLIQEHAEREQVHLLVIYLHRQTFSQSMSGLWTVHKQDDQNGYGYSAVSFHAFIVMTMEIIVSIFTATVELLRVFALLRQY